jgi:hypothetical protein
MENIQQFERGVQESLFMQQQQTAHPVCTTDVQG